MNRNPKRLAIAVPEIVAAPAVSTLAVALTVAVPEIAAAPRYWATAFAAASDAPAIVLELVQELEADASPWALAEAVPITEAETVSVAVPEIDALSVDSLELEEAPPASLADVCAALAEAVPVIVAAP